MAPAMRATPAMARSSTSTETGWRTLLHRGEALPLQPKVLDALHHFVLQPRVLVPRDALTQALWPDTHVTANSLEQVIRKLRAALGDTERPYRWIETVPGKGYRFVGELEIKPQARPGFAHDPLAARSARAPLTNLPRRDPGFVGREADCQALADLVRDHPLVTVVGPGGIGGSGATSPSGVPRARSARTCGRRGRGSRHPTTS